MFAVAVSNVSEPCVNVPIAPSADLTAKHCSSMGAQQAEKSRKYLWSQMLELYAVEPRTDAEIAALLWQPHRMIMPSTISARRKELIQQGLVAPESCGTRKNPRTGVSNSLWQLVKR
jgi:hypothetical protein